MTSLNKSTDITKNTEILSNFEETIFEPAQHLLSLFLKTYFEIYKENTGISELIELAIDSKTHFREDGIVLEVSKTEKPVLYHEIESESLLNLIYTQFIHKVKESNSKNLVMELLFLHLINNLEIFVTSISTKENKQQILELKLEVYSIIMDFVKYICFVKDDCQQDLPFILLKDFFQRNTLEFCYKFWSYMECRKSTFYSNKKEKYSLKRRSGRLIAQIITDLIYRLEIQSTSKKDDSINGMNVTNSVFSRKTEFRGQLCLYFCYFFDISKKNFWGPIEDLFQFNEDSSIPIPRDTSAASNFYKMKSVLDKPTSVKDLRNQEKESIRKGLMNFIDDFKQNAFKANQSSKPTAGYPNSLDVNDRLSNQITNVPLLKFFETNGEIDLEASKKDIYHTKFIQEKSKHYNEDNDIYSSVSQTIVNNDIFKKMNYSDYKFKLQVILQIYIFANFMNRFCNEKYVREYYTDFNMFNSDISTFIEKEKQSITIGNNLLNKKANSIDSKTFTNVYSKFGQGVSLSHRDSHYYEALMGKINDHFKINNKSFNFIIYLLMNQNNDNWFFMKLNKFDFFEIETNLESFQKALDSLVNDLYERCKNPFDKNFAIKFGNRDITKILANKKRTLDKLDESNFDINTSNEQEDDLLFWKKSRFSRDKGEWFNLKSQVKQKLSIEDKINKSEENSSSNMAFLKSKLQMLEAENKILSASASEYSKKLGIQNQQNYENLEY